MDCDSDTDSLFSDAQSSSGSCGPGHAPEPLSDPPVRIASRRAPPIPGLFFFADILPPSTSTEVVSAIAKCGYFSSEAGRNQAMLFERAPSSSVHTSSQTSSQQTPHDGIAGSTSRLPAWVGKLVQELRARLRGKVDHATYELLFAASHPDESRVSSDEQVESLRSRQLILNLYKPGEGLSPHIDLLRFGDGIMLASFGAPHRGTVMEFTRQEDGAEGETHTLFLSSNSVLILSKEARYGWKHGIPARQHDMVREERLGDANGHIFRLERGTRLSVTLRWMSKGGDVVGSEDDLPSGPMPAGQDGGVSH